MSRKRCLELSVELFRMRRSSLPIGGQRGRFRPREPRDDCRFMCVPYELTNGDTLKIGSERIRLQRH